MKMSSRNINFLSIFTVYAKLVNVVGLLCHCDICPDTNNTCKTDGYCFTSLSKHMDSIRRAYRCFNKDKLFPPDLPLWCFKPKNGTGSNNKAAIMCCQDYDYCNLDLKPTLDEGESGS